MPSAWQGIELFPKWKELNPPSPGRARPHDFPHDSDSLGRQFCKNPHVLHISAEHPQIFRTYSRTTSRTTRRRPPPGTAEEPPKGEEARRLGDLAAGAARLLFCMCNLRKIPRHALFLYAAKTPNMRHFATCTAFTQRGILWRTHIREPRPA